MRDREQEYPKHQPGRGEHHHHDPFEPDVEAEGELEEEPPRRRPLHQREEATTPELPPHHIRNALLIGIIAGVLATLQLIMLTLINASAYQAAKGYSSDKIPWNIAIHIVGIYFLSLGISTLIYFVSGIIIGKVSVHRRWAFIGGFVGGAISSLIDAILKQISIYPDSGTSGFSGNPLNLSGGFIFLLVVIALNGLIVGGVTLFGAWLTTRRHPYYVGYSG
jgi:hypothetical protein